MFVVLNNQFLLNVFQRNQLTLLTLVAVKENILLHRVLYRQCKAKNILL